ncbi:MAG TPA: DinB family protein [Candidatus Limnocylindria bacterium]
MSAVTDALAERANRLHDTALKLVARVDEDVLLRRFGPTAPPPGFHLWHMARWADRMQALASAVVPALGPAQQEIWVRERIADGWGVTVPLGTFDTGMEMGDETAARLVLPGKALLLEYATRAFAAAQRAFALTRDEDLERMGTDLYGKEGSVASLLVGHLQHLNRHLGMIEALVGVSGTSGTASV